MVDREIKIFFSRIKNNPFDLWMFFLFLIKAFFDFLRRNVFKKSHYNWIIPNTEIPKNLDVVEINFIRKNDKDLIQVFKNQLFQEVFYKKD